MAIIKSGATTDLLTIGATSKAARVTLYDDLGASMGRQRTYRASTIIPLVTAVTANRTIWNIIGSATTTVTIKKIRISGVSIATAVNYVVFNLVKYSTATTGGTSTTLVAVPLDSASAAATFCCA